jgi:hypothetical protein
MALTLAISLSKLIQTHPCECRLFLGGEPIKRLF